MLFGCLPANYKINDIFPVVCQQVRKDNEKKWTLWIVQAWKGAKNQKTFRSPSNKQREKGKNLILNFHLKRISEEKEKFSVKSITNCWNFSALWSLLSIAISSMSFIFFRLTTYYSRSMAIKDFFFFSWAFEMEISIDLSLLSDKRCSLNQIENGDFFAFLLVRKMNLLFTPRNVEKKALFTI